MDPLSISRELISVLNSTMLTMLVAAGLILGFRYLQLKTRQIREESVLRDGIAGVSGSNITIKNSPTDSKGEMEGGFQFFEVNELQKRAFVDAFNGFKEYTELKGYNVGVFIDATRPGLIGLKITVRDTGVTVSTSRVRADIRDYIRKIHEHGDFSDMPMVTDPIEHSRLVAALKMRFDFIRHQAEMNATAAEAYRAILSTVVKQGIGAIGHLPAPTIPTVHVQIGTEGGYAMSSNYTANQSPGAAVGTNNTAGITGSVVTIGTTAAERDKQAAAINALVDQIRASSLAPEQKEEASRSLANVKDELKEDQADKGRIARWLNRTRDIIAVGKAGAELIEKSEEVYKMFGETG